MAHPALLPLPPLWAPPGDAVSLYFRLLDGPGLAAAEDDPALAQAHRAEVLYPAASLVKLPLLARVLALAEAGELDWDHPLPLARENRVGGAGILREFGPYLRVSAHDMARLMIAHSDNTAANQLMDLAGGCGAVTAQCRALGLGHTVLRRKMMDSAAAAAGRDNHTCAADIGRFLALAASERLVSQAASRTTMDFLSAQRLRGKLPALLPATRQVPGQAAPPTGQVWVAHKTGELPHHQHDAGVFTLPGGWRYILVALGGPWPRPQDGQQAIARLSLQVYRRLTRHLRSRGYPL